MRTLIQGLSESFWMNIRYCSPYAKAAPLQRGKHTAKLKHFLEGMYFHQ